ncbi:MAG: hypothetical protein ACYSW8_31580 [Planctomycetota bacterium]|jgi:hypothetical protein
MPKFIEERPSFQELRSLANNADGLGSFVESLAEADFRQIVERATDLLGAAEQFVADVRGVVTEE